MAIPADKLASSLEALETLQQKGVAAIRSVELSRTHRERLVSAGFLKRVIKGWYIASRPDETQGESTAWYTSFWSFMAQYLATRFDDQWSLSPEQSLILHSGNCTVPRQLLVRAPSGRNRITEFPHDTSIFEVRANIADGDALAIIDDLRIFTVEAALIEVSDSFFENHPTDARAMLATVPDASGLLARLLSGGHTRAAGRLAGAFRNIGNDRIANEILGAMKAALHEVREADPFLRALSSFDAGPVVSPHVRRIEIMWRDMRETIIGRLPTVRPVPNDIDAYLETVDAIYVTDAYHSLSIEGYQVSRELIERVRSGAWNPEANKEDREHRNAMAARGYWQAFQSVKQTIRTVLEGKNPGEAASDDLSIWYRELFTPSVTAGILEAPQLAGYRNGPVYIRRSMHVPPGVEAARDCMPVFFDLLREEKDPAVRIILGHFIFVYIHPYFDGNGRTARFLMNVMIAAAGLPWTVVRLEHRETYMMALETASVSGDIRPSADLIDRIIQDTLDTASES
ncbi:MAG: Fic family protein [Roseovarius sp.]|nr:Fic family protein [Roseovarius sp.]